ncbi:MAG: glycosyltransferase family 4 protein [Kaiparowitsia implicata GSE-PSE-MK54-09C]|jgi:glycosyltransferase involved in cell wall biosynthesis|nr:glycosyltransferase family 4 protein [Kaiparowitsia implicata GSE-PSE-MK54-09C]
MRVLLLADCCNPDWPSLPIVGYKYAKAIANYADVVVATQIRNQPNISRDGLGNAEVVYLDTEAIAAPISRLASLLRGGAQKAWTLQMAMDYPTYLAFEWYAWRTFKPQLERGEFDLVHRITPMTPTLPSPMASWSPVPFVLGPLNGNLPWPAAFTAELKREREWLSKLRQFYKVMPFHQSTYSRSSAILAAFDHTMADLPEESSAKVMNVPEVGIDPAVFSPTVRPKRDRLTILYAGRLVPYKLPEVVIRAMINSPQLQQHRLVMVGDGPERPRLEQLIAEHNLGHCVDLLGQKPQAEVGQLMREADIFAFPSIRELGAGVVVEAMACGMACVVVDYGGPATLIQGDRGVKVPLGTFDQLVDRFVVELEALVGNPDRVRELGQTAYHHAMTYYSWDAKARKTLELYDWVLGKTPTKPDFWEQPIQSQAFQEV